MEFLGKRISLNSRPARQAAVVFEVAMLGHCPGRVRIERLLALPDVVASIRAQGFGDRLDELLAVNDDLYHLPIPLHSYAEFDDIFPDAKTTITQYRSRLAGSTAWLAWAVEDFFANGGEKVWIITVPETEGVQGFLPDLNTPLYDVENLRGISVALVLNQVGLVALPDLERLQIPANLNDISRMRLANPDPQFIPCGQAFDDGHRERRRSSELTSEFNDPLTITQLLKRLLGFMDKHRPDMQCLLSLPMDFSEALGSPGIDHDAVDNINRIRQQSYGYLLRQVQFLFPYLRSASRSALYSSVGAVSGMIANSAAERGAWRSIAGLPMQTDAQPFPPVDMIQKVALREVTGIGVIDKRIGKVSLDDERICVPALFRGDYQVGEISDYLQGTRSGEVVRFLGFLRRELQTLGERLIFNLDYRDPRPQIIVNSFFRELYQQGALRGRTADEAFTVRQISTQDSIIAFNIKVAPAFPIDKIQLTFVNRQGEWATEVTDG
jgi:hypothetical protein